MSFDIVSLVKTYGREYVSLHNHSTYSDGGCSVEEMCRAAKASGLKVFGMSDHWTIFPEPTGENRWWMEPEKLGEYIDEINRLKKILEDDTFLLKIGVEIDFFFENIDSVLAELAGYPLDYLIGSVHYVGKLPVDNSMKYWDPLSEEERDIVCHKYWEKVAGAAARKEFAFVGHLDLVKKFGIFDNPKYFPDAFRVLDALEKSGGCFELNTAGWFKECREQYPAIEILQEAARRNIPAIISADAHDANHVRRNFSEAASLLATAGHPASL